MDERVVNKVVQHGRVFADFWLGLVGAGVQGMAQVVGKPRPNNEEKRSVRQIVEGVVERTASGLHVALKGATDAAQSAEEELKKLHPQERKGANGAPHSAGARTNGHKHREKLSPEDHTG